MTDDESRLTLEERGLLMHALGLARQDAQKLAASMSEIGERHFKERAEQYRLIAFKVSRWGVREHAKENVGS